jgi:hypothetical protein
MCVCVCVRVCVCVCVRACACVCARVMQGPWEKMRGRGGGAESEVKHGMPLTNLPLANVPQGMRGWSRRGGVGVYEALSY